MAQNKKTTPQTPDTGNVENLDNGQTDTTATTPAVDATKAAYAVLNATLKAAGFDSKAMYTRYVVDPDDVTEDLAAQVAKHAKNSAKGFDQATMDSIIAMFDAMAKANAPKAKLVKTIPDGLAEDLAQAWFNRQQVLAQYEAAKAAVEKLWCEPRDVSKNELDAVCKAVTDAGFTPDRKTGTIKTTKSGSTTNGEHGNSGKTKLSIGWTINVGTVTYSGWKDVAEKLVPSVFKGDVNTNYLANTAVLDKVIEMDLPVEVWAKVNVKDQDHDAALAAWEKSAAKAKLDSHPSVTVHVS